MRSIRKSLLQFIFSGANMRRWNDKLRPVELFELDKQAHKMIAAFLLWQQNAGKLSEEEHRRMGTDIIEGGIFDYFYRLIITDIKPPVFYRIKANKEHYAELTAWTLKELEPRIRPLDEDFWQRLVHYHQRPAEEANRLSDRILSAAHMYASRWEFTLIEPLNAFDEEIKEIGPSFNKRLLALKDVEGVNELLAGSGTALARMANLCGQLRFQIRWAQTPRVPATSVLGHMFIVAVYAYLFSLYLDGCAQRRINDFYCGLFHDLAELLTRDIITPVKRSVAQLPEIIHQYEDEELHSKILDPLEQEGYGHIRERLDYYLGLATKSEFNDTCRVEGNTVKKEGFLALQEGFNRDAYDPKDGQLIKACDTLAAFIEAYSSIHNGMGSPHLYEAMARMRRECSNIRLGSFSMAPLLADFD
ncbi:HD domain-containing protein [Mailhella massiliensis]|uniref:HD domain-containing protein n=1 Tax=Mailhella massiliensis TaxID=1903261 RepID=A0A921AWZ5_9BACT|nr:HD domain-containing protein [Mailhella massiliensis]HJD97659.1 HD domain-containing protein [Mailhella massiliensis]